MNYEKDVAVAVWQATTLLHSDQPDVAEAVCTVMASMLDPDMETNLWTVEHCSPSAHATVGALRAHFLGAGLTEAERRHIDFELSRYLRARSRRSVFPLRGQWVHCPSKTRRMKGLRLAQGKAPYPLKWVTHHATRVAEPNPARWRRFWRGDTEPTRRIT